MPTEPLLLPPQACTSSSTLRVDTEAQALGTTRTAAAARRFAENVVPIIQEARANGVVSLRAVALVLNTRGVRTARGGRWAATQVGAVLARVAAAPATLAGEPS